MSTSLHLQRTIDKTLSQRLPDRRKTRRRALAQMITGLHLSQHVHLSRIADYIPGRAQLNSKTRRLRRFLDNDAVDPHRYRSPSLLRARAPPIGPGSRPKQRSDSTPGGHLGAVGP